MHDRPSAVADFTHARTAQCTHTHIQRERERERERELPLWGISGFVHIHPECCDIPRFGRS